MMASLRALERASAPSHSSSLWSLPHAPTLRRLFTESSEEGDRDAQAHLAAMHLQGVGTPKNLAKAVELYTNAAERGHVRAQSALAVRSTQHIVFIR